MIKILTRKLLRNCLESRCDEQYMRHFPALIAKNFLKFLFLLFLLFQTQKPTFASESEWQNDTVSGAKARIIASSLIENGQRIILLGTEFELPDGWKIYGKDSQDIGLPPSFDFKDSKNYNSQEIQWPKAKIAEEKIADKVYRYDYYDKKVIIPIKISLKDENQPAELALNLNFGICKDVCVPVSMKFSLTIDAQPDCHSVNLIRQYQDLKPANQEQKFNQIDLSLPQDSNEQNPVKLWKMLLIALIGGAILNIMPCVLPVLSLKILSILKHSRARKSKIRLGFIATIAGIVSCFLFLAIFTFALKQTGSALGWGFQFQNPFFLIFLVQILAFFTADLLGFFEINFSQSVVNLLNKKIGKSVKIGKIFLSNYLSGILAVMLATPCSAPFLGSAISFALTQNFTIILLIFGTIGCGFALPYFALIASPGLLRILPKPGNWMLKIKQLMAGFLVATIVWLISILSAAIGFLPAILVAILAILLFLAMKLKSKILRVISLLIILVGAFSLPFKIHQQEIVRKQELARYWQIFDERALENLVAQNQVVLIDITADWCITCKFNKVLVLESAEINEMLKNGEIIGLRADITQPDSEAMKFLKKHNRFAIPFNAVYGPNLKNGQATTELLSKEELLRLIKRAKNSE